MLYYLLEQVSYTPFYAFQICCAHTLVLWSCLLLLFLSSSSLVLFLSLSFQSLTNTSLPILTLPLLFSVESSLVLFLSLCFQSLSNTSLPILTLPLPSVQLLKLWAVGFQRYRSSKVREDPFPSARVLSSAPCHVYTYLPLPSNVRVITPLHIPPLMLSCPSRPQTSLYCGFMTVLLVVSAAHTMANAKTVWKFICLPLPS